jgi:hypothetical protein
MPAVRGPSHYHRHGHRRRLEFTLRHAGRLNHKQVRNWVHGDHVDKTRAKDDRIHLQLDTANGDFVPHVKQFDRTVVRLRHKAYHGDPNLHKLIAPVSTSASTAIAGPDLAVSGVAGWLSCTRKGLRRRPSPSGRMPRAKASSFAFLIPKATASSSGSI